MEMVENSIACDCFFVGKRRKCGLCSEGVENKVWITEIRSEQVENNKV